MKAKIAKAGCMPRNNTDAGASTGKPEKCQGKRQIIRHIHRAHEAHG